MSAYLSSKSLCENDVIIALLQTRGSFVCKSMPGKILGPFNAIIFFVRRASVSNLPRFNLLATLERRRVGKREGRRERERDDPQ